MAWGKNEFSAVTLPKPHATVIFMVELAFPCLSLLTLLLCQYQFLTVQHILFLLL